MEFLRPSRRRTMLSETIYVILNVLMAGAILGVVLAVESPLPALGLVLLSKWRIFAVRPQHWYANLTSNLVDIIVSVSFVIWLYLASGALSAQIALTLFYIAWLLFLKPQSKRVYIVLQAGVGVFVGVTALMHVSYDWYASPVVLLMWLIGYSAARHVLLAYKEAHFALLSLIWGLILAEVGWLLYHWNFAYHLGFAGKLQISQAAIVVTLLCFLAERAYASYHYHQTIRLNDILLPLLLTVGTIGMLLTVFGGIKGGI
ncbi:MAG TPA: hypothetical protein VGE34_00240 [Candidatus Saccharimonadales bacterium]